jgi:Inner membrane protein YgaP-like, transmembrane domain
MNYRNESNPDRAVRVALGVLMLAAGWTGLADGLWKIALEVFGWVPLATGLIGWCPIYALLGLSTRRPRAENGGR